MSVLHVDLLRHGQTGQQGFRGQLDDALDETGWQSMRAAVSGRRWDVVVSSPLRRCADFARDYAARHGLDLHLDADWMECHFGAWQGVPLADIHRQHADALGRFWSDPMANPPPGGESMVVFAERVHAALDRLLQMAAGQRVLVLTHGGVIRLLRCRVERRDWRELAALQVPHASLFAMTWPLETG